MIGFFTYDLIEGRERLMPWRTIIEVCKEFKNSHNKNVAIYSLDCIPKNKYRIFQSIKIYSVDKKFVRQKNFFKINKFSSVFFPVVWRTSYNSIKYLISFNGKKIAYFPAGVYNMSQVMNAINYIGFRTSLPYLLDAFVPKKRVVKVLKKLNFNSVITLTDLTRKKIIGSGFLEKNVVCIPPGKDLLPDFKKQKLIKIKDKNFKMDKYFLYMGGTAKIRGLELLFESFDLACKINHELQLICFLRTDPNSENTYINNLIENCNFKSNITIVWREVSKDILFNFVSKAKAVILPFLLIPSEIPLTYLEVISLGTTIISTKNGGTTDYLSDSIFITEHNKKSIKETLLKVWENDYLVAQKKNNANIKIANHPCWKLVGSRWYSYI